MKFRPPRSARTIAPVRVLSAVFVVPVFVAAAVALAALGSALVAAPAHAADPASASTPTPLLITVDDLPIAGALHEEQAERERITRGLLEALAKHRIRAVGLVTWNNVKSDADLDLLEMWLEAGHELGNHSRAHLDYTRTDSTAYIDDMEAGRAALAGFLRERGWCRCPDGVWRKATGTQADREASAASIEAARTAAAAGREHDPRTGERHDSATCIPSAENQRVRFFRFPYLREGETSAKLAAMRRYLAASGQRNLHVTIDYQDWDFEKPWVEARRRGDAAEMERVAARYHESLHLETRCHEEESERLFERVPPQILLLHANEVGAANWDSLFAWFERSGHRFATVDEVLADSAFAGADACEFLSRYGGSLWFRFSDCERRAAAHDAVATLLGEQAAAWNRGDLEGFCSVYSDDATFVSPSGTSQGRAMILDRYRAKYPDASAMGTLTLEVVEGRAAGGPEVSMLGDVMPGRIHAYSVAARWTLAYPAGAERETKSGMTLLVLHREGGAWKIVQDASM
jgi:uncharacterized protein (TIGR02246 family)